MRLVDEEHLDITKKLTVTLLEPVIQLKILWTSAVLGEKGRERKGQSIASFKIKCSGMGSLILLIADYMKISECTQRTNQPMSLCLDFAKQPIATDLYSPPVHGGLM